MPPFLIAIDHDDYEAKYVGHTADGRQFFLTHPFVPAIGGEPGREFIALYLFDQHGRFLDARIDDLGSRSCLDIDHARRLTSQRLGEIGATDYCRIELQPFQIERFGVMFGLVYEAPEDDEESESVIVEPGNYMAFHEPWDNGEYDT